jgi:hypothetical protein
MLIIIKGQEFFADVENNEAIWTPIKYLACFPSQIILFPTMDMAVEDQENLELGGEIVPLGRILSITPS